MRLYLYWIFLVFVVFVGDVVDAAFAPADRAALKSAVGSCLSESGDGSCPTFSASNDATGNSYNAMGEWNISKVTSLKELFRYKNSFNADISKWQTGSVITMKYSTSTPSSKQLCFL